MFDTSVAKEKTCPKDTHVKAVFRPRLKKGSGISVRFAWLTKHWIKKTSILVGPEVVTFYQRGWAGVGWGGVGGDLSVSFMLCWKGKNLAPTASTKLIFSTATIGWSFRAIIYSNEKELLQITFLKDLRLMQCTAGEIAETVIDVKLSISLSISVSSTMSPIWQFIAFILYFKLRPYRRHVGSLHDSSHTAAILWHNWK